MINISNALFDDNNHMQYSFRFIDELNPYVEVIFEMFNSIISKVNNLSVMLRFAF